MGVDTKFPTQDGMGGSWGQPAPGGSIVSMVRQARGCCSAGPSFLLRELHMEPRDGRMAQNPELGLGRQRTLVALGMGFGTRLRGCKSCSCALSVQVPPT